MTTYCCWCNGVADVTIAKNTPPKTLARHSFLNFKWNERFWDFSANQDIYLFSFHFRKCDIVQVRPLVNASTHGRVWLERDIPFKSLIA